MGVARLAKARQQGDGNPSCLVSPKVGVGELSFFIEFVVFYKFFISIFRLKSTRIEMDILPLLAVVWYGLVPEYLFQNMETALLYTVTLRNLFRNTSVILFCRSFKFHEQPL
jgi:hypothetical protein